MIMIPMKLKRLQRRRCVAFFFTTLVDLFLLTSILLFSLNSHKCLALFQTTSQSKLLLIMRREPHLSAFNCPPLLFRQMHLELHALFRPDGNNDKRTPLLRTTTTKNDNINGGKGGIKITGTNAYKHVPSSSSSMDKLRLDAIRSEVSIKIAEERVKRLENELKEMTKKYNWAQSALRDRSSSNSVRHPSSFKGQNPSSQGQQQQQPRQKHPPPPPVQQQLKMKPVNEKNLVSSSIESLPPFAAGLFEQAERAEMERRAKRGLIEESDLLLSSLLASTKMTVERKDDREEEKIPFMDGYSSVTDSNFSSSEPALLVNSNVVVGKSIEIEIESEAESIDIVNASAVGDTSVTNDAEKELISLRKQCVVLSHKLSRSEELRRAQTDELRTSLKSEKILRGLNADWTRRLSDARKEMDEEKATWNKQLEEKIQIWEQERNGFEERLKVLQCEVKELQFRLESQDNITFVANLFCGLLRERVACRLLETRNRLFPGGAKASLGQNETQTFVFSSPNLTWRRLRCGKKNIPNRMLTVGGANEPRRTYRLLRWVRMRTIGISRVGKSMGNEMNFPEDDEENPPPSSPPPGLEPLAPLLMTRKTRLPKKLRTEEKSKSPSLVPNFLRKGK